MKFGPKNLAPPQKFLECAPLIIVIIRDSQYYTGFSDVLVTRAVLYPRANGAERRSGRKPGARVTNSALAFTYIRIMRSYIAQWHSGMKSRPPFWIWTLDGFRCFAHAQVSTS